MDPLDLTTLHNQNINITLFWRFQLHCKPGIIQFKLMKIVCIYNEKGWSKYKMEKRNKNGVKKL